MSSRIMRVLPRRLVALAAALSRHPWAIVVHAAVKRMVEAWPPSSDVLWRWGPLVLLFTLAAKLSLDARKLMRGVAGVDRADQEAWRKDRAIKVSADWKRLSDRVKEALRPCRGEMQVLEREGAGEVSRAEAELFVAVRAALAAVEARNLVSAGADLSNGASNGEAEGEGFVLPADSAEHTRCTLSTPC